MPVWDKQHEDEELVRGRYSAKSTRPWDTMLDESLAPKRYWLLEYTGIAISNDDETAAGYHPGRITNGANVFGVFLLVRARVFRLQFWVQLLALYGWAFFYKYVLADSNSTTGEVGRLDTVTNDTFDAVQGLAIFVLTLYATNIVGNVPAARVENLLGSCAPSSLLARRLTLCISLAGVLLQHLPLQGCVQRHAHAHAEAAAGEDTC
jgi:hypothetical protein